MDCDEQGEELTLVQDFEEAHADSEGMFDKSASFCFHWQLTGWQICKGGCLEIKIVINYLLVNLSLRKGLSFLRNFGGLFDAYK